MLEMRPNCEWCDRDLGPGSLDARICTYECTFCATCVDNVLHNVCPNCGGGFVPRPIRAAQARRPGVNLEHHPASGKRIHSRYERAEIEAFIKDIEAIDPGER